VPAVSGNFDNIARLYVCISFPLLAAFRRHRRFGTPDVAVTLSPDQYLAEFGLPGRIISERNLVLFEEAEWLEVAEVGNNGKEYLLTPAAAKNWRRLKRAAAADDESIFIVSAFRSISRQADIIRGKLAAGESIEQIIKRFAPPGFSEHHSGHAVDLSTSGIAQPESEFEGSTAFAWLRQNAGRFGYRLSYPRENTHGYRYGPWHWCYRPSDINTDTIDHS